MWNRCCSATMVEINTFVFFDIEATGYRNDRPKITEIAFTGILRKDLLDATDKTLPRIKYKLLIPLNPMKVIHPIVTQKTGKLWKDHFIVFFDDSCQWFHFRSPFFTGLDNYLLEYVKPMDANTINLMNCFFEQLNRPVCLVAHFGNEYDYPILRDHIRKLVFISNDKIVFWMQIEERLSFTVTELFIRWRPFVCWFMGNFQKLSSWLIVL